MRLINPDAIDFRCSYGGDCTGGLYGNCKTCEYYVCDYQEMQKQKAIKINYAYGRSLKPIIKKPDKKFEEVHVYLVFEPKDLDEDIPINVDFYGANMLFKHPELRKSEILHTTQIHFLNFRYGKRLFVHTPGNMVHEITIGECKGTNREIKEAHILEKMLIAGEFDWF